MSRALPICTLLIGGVLLSGRTVAQSVPTVSGDKGTSSPTTISKQEHAFRLLNDLEEQARGLKDPATQSFFLWQIGAAYAPSDQKRAVSLLRDAFAATLSPTNEESRSERGKLQGRILETLLTLDPSQATELAGQADATARHHLLVTQIEKENEVGGDISRAMQFIQGASRYPDFPYDAVVHLMLAYPDKRQAVFESAQASFLLEKSPGNSWNSEDLATLIVRFWSTLPRNEVLSAMDQILEKAKDDTRVYCIGAGLPLGSARTLIFDNAYQYRLFELLPILEKLDSQKGRNLRKQEAAVSSSLSKYPRGLESFTANDVRLDGPLLDSFYVTSDRQNVTEYMKEQKLFSEALHQFSKRQSFASFKSLPDPSMRSEALLWIAESTVGWRGPHPSIDAIHELINLLPDLPPLNAGHSAVAAAEIAEAWEDKTATENALNAGAVAAGELLRQEIKERNSKGNLPEFWPATLLYIKLVSSGSHFSGPWIEKMLGEIPNVDIRSLATIAYARALLGQQAYLRRDWSDYR